LRIVAVGSGRSVHTLHRSAAMAMRGHEVRLVTAGPVLPVGGVEVLTRPLPVSLRQAVAAARSFLDDIRSFRPDLLHLHYAGGKLGTMATLAGIHPLVVTVMGGDVLPQQHPRGLPLLERRATRRILEEADLILVKSDALRDAVAVLGEFAAPVQTVRWGVDAARFRRDPDGAGRARLRLRLAPADRVILSPRILSPLYNIHLVVEAMGAVLNRVPEALLLVAEYNADAAYRASIQAQIASLGRGDRIRLVGHIEPGDMPSLYSLAEVVVSVPSSDGLPQTLFEAMACEVPVVLGRLPAYEEIVRDGETAILVDLSADGVARGLLRILEDAPLQDELTRRALARLHETALLPRELDRVEALYRGLLPRASGDRRRRGRLLDTLALALR
jgi:glycosyltransferase involved in cell wall biosynthesis